MIYFIEIILSTLRQKEAALTTMCTSRYNDEPALLPLSRWHPYGLRLSWKSWYSFAKLIRKNMKACFLITD